MRGLRSDSQRFPMEPCEPSTGIASQSLLLRLLRLSLAVAARDEDVLG